MHNQKISENENYLSEKNYDEMIMIKTGITRLLRTQCLFYLRQGRERNKLKKKNDRKNTKSKQQQCLA